jgi:hypothetical protein
LSPQGAAIEVLGSGFDWSEGCCWIKDKGFLVFSDIPPNKIMKWDPKSGISLFMERVGYTGKVIRRSSAEADYLVDNPNRRCPTIEKARRELGYNPSVPIDEGLRRALTWYHYNREAEDA